MFNKVLLLVIFGLITITLSAQKYSNEFLAIGVGARALGMSNAQVAICNDVTSGYWNPAGLTSITDNVQIAYMHSNYFANIAKYDYGAITIPVDKSTRIGLSFIRLGVDDIPNTLNLFDNNGTIRYDQISSFSVADYAFLFSFARKSDKKLSSYFSLPDPKRFEELSYGANVKVIYRDVAQFATAWGFGLDIGTQYRYQKWRFGAMGKDITSTFNAWHYNPSTFSQTFLLTGNDIPKNSLEITVPSLILGSAYEFKIKERFTILPEIDLINTFDGRRNTLVSTRVVSIDPRIGLEIGFDKIVFLRAGIGNFQQIKDVSSGAKSWEIQPNMGIGVKILNFTLDYALTNFATSSEGLYSHIFSLKLNLNKREHTGNASL